MAVTLYQHTEQGTTKLAEVQPEEVYNLPISTYEEKTPLKIGIGCVWYIYMCQCVQWNLRIADILAWDS